MRQMIPAASLFTTLGLVTLSVTAMASPAEIRLMPSSEIAVLAVQLASASPQEDGEDNADLEENSSAETVDAPDKAKTYRVQCAGECDSDRGECEQDCPDDCEDDDDPDCQADCSEECSDEHGECEEECEDDAADLDADVAVEELDVGGLRIRVERKRGSSRHRRHRSHRSHRRDHGDRDEVVIMGGSGRIEADEVVDSAVVLGGSLTILGRVRGDAVVMGGSLELEPGAVVEGDTVTMGGSLIVPDGATVMGEQINMEGDLGAIVSEAIGFGHPFEYNIRWPSFSAVLLQLLALVALALLLMAFAADRVHRVRTYLFDNPARSAFAGLGLLVGFVPLCLLLCVSLVGIPLIPIVLVAVIVLCVMGLTAFAGFLGDKLPLFQDKKTPVTAMLLGMALISVVAFIPVVGAIVTCLLAVFTAGAALLTRFGTPARQADKSEPAPPSPPPDNGAKALLPTEDPS